MSPSMLRSAETASINDRQRTTLESGDLICTGTPHRVGDGQTSLRYLKINDLVAVKWEPDRTRAFGQPPQSLRRAARAG
jgi:2-keto-4-pentenoate hydratase/2-oxohepta-3-ene-1,7-dioic acid hydratase in catechol pathway